MQSHHTNIVFLEFPITYILKNKGLKRYCYIYLRECQKIKSETAESIRRQYYESHKEHLKEVITMRIGRGIRKPSTNEGMLNIIARYAEVDTPREIKVRMSDAKKHLRALLVALETQT
jgi:hypothetical protein